MMNKKGKLIVIGSGIKSIAHFTLESQAHLQQADIVLYAAADPVTDMWIEKQNPNSFDLYQYYGNNKSRIITYTQMIERIMEEVRADKYVCALFYGHPGVFVTPSHNAIELARREGYEAEMLPGISAEDCLFADLGVDPSIPGLQTYEATDLLLRKRPINNEINAIIWQVGCVGDVGFKFHGYTNEKFNILLDYLEQYYPPDQEIVNYVASMFTMTKSRIERHKLSDYRDPTIAKQVTGISTFFIPALKMTQSDDEASNKLGLKTGSARPTPLIFNHEMYPQYKKVALKNISEHQIPEGYKFSFSSKELYDLVSNLALNFRELDRFRENPREYLKNIPGLTSNERHILNMQHYGALRMLFKRDPEVEATLFVEEAMRNLSLAKEYLVKQKTEHTALKNKEINTGEYEARIVKWFLDNRYATTPSAVTRAIKQISFNKVLNFSGEYKCRLKENNNSRDLTVVIDREQERVEVDGRVVSKPLFENDHVIWQSSEKNQSVGILSFLQENDEFILNGKYSSDSSVLPETFNLTGKNN